MKRRRKHSRQNCRIVKSTKPCKPKESRRGGCFGRAAIDRTLPGVNQSKVISQLKAEMINQLQLLAAVLIAALITVDCKAQNISEHDAKVLKKLNAERVYGSYGYAGWNGKPMVLDKEGNITAISFRSINGDIGPLLELEHLKQLQISEMKTGWLKRIAKKYPDLDGLNFEVSGLTDDDLATIGEFKRLSNLVMTGDNSDGASCMRNIGQLTGLKSFVMPVGWQRHATELKALTKLESLRIGQREYRSPKMGGEWVYSVSGGYLDFYRLLVDEQKRSLKEASEVIGILSGGRISVPGNNEQLIPYLNGIDAASELNLSIAEASKEKFEKLKIPVGLKKLSLSGYPGPKLLANISKLDSIEHLTFAGQIKGYQFRGLNGLKTLIVNGCTLGSQGLSIAEGFKELEYLELSNCTVGKDGLSFFTKLKSLKTLDFGSSKLISVDLSYMSSLNELERIEFSKCKLGQLDLEVEGFRELQHLEISDCDIGKDGLLFLAKFRGLKTLDFNRCKLVGVDLSHMSSSTALEHLKFYQCELDKFDLVALAGSKGISHLDFGAYYDESDLLNLQNLKVISGLNNLSYLDIGRVPLKDSDLIHLQSLKKLNELKCLGQTTSHGRFKLYEDLNFSPLQCIESEGGTISKDKTGLSILRKVDVSDELVESVAKLNSLTKISVWYHSNAIKIANARPFEEMRFHGCVQLNNKAIELLSKNQKLKSLRIVGSKLITDEGFQLLERMTWLEKLNFVGRGVSKSAKESLKAKLPNCEVDKY